MGNLQGRLSNDHSKLDLDEFAVPSIENGGGLQHLCYELEFLSPVFDHVSL